MDSPERKATKQWGNPKQSFLGQIPDIMRKLISRIVQKLAMYMSGPDCGEDAVGHMLDESVGGGVAELASGERVDGDAFLSWC